MSAIVACWVIFSFSGSRDAFRQREIIKPRVVTIATPLNQKVRIRSEGLAAGMGALYCHYCVCQWSFTVSNRIPTVVASERPFRSRSSYLKSIIVIHGRPASEGGLQPHNIWWSGISYRLSMQALCFHWSPSATPLHWVSAGQSVGLIGRAIKLFKLTAERE